MSFKKKMGLGIMTGALGLSLIGGGTYAAFNDVETVDNTFAAGTLDLATNSSAEKLFNLSNLKPGDEFEETLTLTNNGSLDINQIKVKTSVSGWVDVEHEHLPTSINGKSDGKNSLNEFLDQFNVTITRDSTQLWSGTAKHLQSLNGHEITGTNAETAALDPEETMDVKIEVKFLDKQERYPDGSRYFEQNKFQDEGADVTMSFEATQMPGEDRSNDAE